MADATPAPKARTGSVQSIERAFSLLELMADAGGTLALSQLANQSGLPLRSTGCSERWSISATSVRSRRANTFSVLG